LLAATLRSEHDGGRSAPLAAFPSPARRLCRRARLAVSATRLSACARARTPKGAWFYVSEAVRTPRVGMKGRVESGQPALSGMFTRAEVTYAWPRDDGTVSSNLEPLALFTGKAVHAYLGHLSDAAIEAILNDLATELGAALGQERIYVTFAERAWIWMPASIAGDPWPRRRPRVVSEHRVFVCRAPRTWT